MKIATFLQPRLLRHRPVLFSSIFAAFCLTAVSNFHSLKYLVIVGRNLSSEGNGKFSLTRKLLENDTARGLMELPSQKANDHGEDDLQGGLMESPSQKANDQEGGISVGTGETKKSDPAVAANGSPDGLVQSNGQKDLPIPSFHGPNTNPGRPWTAMCAVALSEERYIDEWVDYHLGIGFGHLYVFDRNPSNPLTEWSMNKTGVQVIPFSNSTRTGSLQDYLITSCLQSLKKLATPPKYVMWLDIDEFLVLKQNYTKVTDFLDDYLKKGLLMISWQIFGTANETRYRNEPVTKRFRYTQSLPDKGTKPAVILDHVIHSRHVHSAKLIEPYNNRSFKRGTNGAMPGRFICCLQNGDVSVAAIHHYQYKSEEEFHYRRCVRSRINGREGLCNVYKQFAVDTFNDEAWQTLIKNVPSYARFGV